MHRYLVIKKEEQVKLLVEFLVRQAATSSLRNISAATGSNSRIKQAVLKWGVNMESLRIQQINTVVELVLTSPDQYWRNMYGKKFISGVFHAIMQSHLACKTLKTAL